MRRHNAGLRAWRGRTRADRRGSHPGTLPFDGRFAARCDGALRSSTGQCLVLQVQTGRPGWQQTERLAGVCGRQGELSPGRRCFSLWQQSQVPGGLAWHGLPRRQVTRREILHARAGLVLRVAGGELRLVAEGAGHGRFRWCRCAQPLPAATTERRSQKGTEQEGEPTRGHLWIRGFCRGNIRFFLCMACHTRLAS